MGILNPPLETGTSVSLLTTTTRITATPADVLVPSLAILKRGHPSPWLSVPAWLHAAPQGSARNLGSRRIN